MLIDFDDTFDNMLQDLTLIKTNQVVVDYKPVNEETIEVIQAVVQTADPNKIKSDKVDISKRYLQIHTETNIKMGYLCEHKGDRYRTFIVEDYSEYGFMEVIFEEIKSA